MLLLSKATPSDRLGSYYASKWAVIQFEKLGGISEENRLNFLLGKVLIDTSPTKTARST
jgi:hypothetical protein